VLALLAVPTELLSPRLSAYKGLEQMLTVKGSRVVAERSGPHALVTVVANDQVPLRQAKGLSLHSPHLPPEQLAIFEDGEGPVALDRFDGDYDAVRYLSWTPAALAYELRPRPARVLVLGEEVPAELMLGGLYGAARIDALVTDPALIGLLTRDLAEFGGWRRQAPQARLHHASARSYLARARGSYDQVRLRLGGAGAGGAGALREDYTATVEGIQAIWQRLSPDGLIAIGSDARLPPRLPLKLLATARLALQGLGVEAPGHHLALTRGWTSTELILAARPLGTDDIRMLRDFADSRGFDLAWHPGIERQDANRHHRLAQPWFYEGAEALLGPDREAFLQRYKFDLHPATDDRPYVFDAFRWRALPELLELRGQGGIGLLEMGYPLLVMTLLQALALSLLLILAPLSALKGGDPALAPAGGRWRVLIYFASIGLAFMFIEIAFIQRFVLLLGDPVRATAVVVSGFLVFAGLGSLTSGRLRAHIPPTRLILIAILTIAVVSSVYLMILPRVGLEIAQLTTIPRLALTYLLVAPLAFFMGMPFPLGLGSTAAWRPDLVPWAWAINGCASVTGALLATLVAVDNGFSIVVIAAVSLYGVASLGFPGAPAGTMQTARSGGGKSRDPAQ
jgi:hypothetical protein